MKLLICALALSAALEGIGLALFPRLARISMIDMARRDDKGIRKTGICCLVLAILLALLYKWLYA